MPGPPPPPGPPPVVKSEAAPPPSALLKSIEKGKKLKKTVTNDRSQPLVDAKPVNASNGGGKRSPPMQRSGLGSRENISNVGASAGVGGLFAGGIPKLRPAGGNVSITDKPNIPPPTRPRGSSNANSNPAPVPVFPRPGGGNPPTVVPRNNPAINKAPSNPPPVVQRTNPPPVANRNNNLPVGGLKPSHQPPPPQPKPTFSHSPNISPRNSEVGINLSRPNAGSERGSGNSLNQTSRPSTIQDGKWTFSNDIPLPRLFPSGDMPVSYAGKKMPPPPPNRSSTAKKPAPAPPQRH